MTGVHRNGLGWNARGVFCGECKCDTCEGCPNEQKVWDGPDEETIKRISEEIDDEDEHLRYKKKLVADKLTHELTQMYKSIIRTDDFSTSSMNIFIKELSDRLGVKFRGD